MLRSTCWVERLSSCPLFTCLVQRYSRFSNLILLHSLEEAMSLPNLRRGLFLALLTLGLLPLSAQTTGQNGTANANPQSNSTKSKSTTSSSGDPQPAKVEVFTGYTWMTLNGTVIGHDGPSPLIANKLQGNNNGLIVNGSYFFNRWFGITAGAAAHFGDRYDADEANIGPVIRFPMGHVQPFIHFLGGWSRIAPNNAEENDSFGLAAGGGLDIRAARHLSFRLIQAEYARSQQKFGLGSSTPIDGVRLSAGLVFLGGVG